MVGGQTASKVTAYEGYNKPYEYHRPISRYKHRDEKAINNNRVQYIFPFCFLI